MMTFIANDYLCFTSSKKLRIQYLFHIQMVNNKTSNLTEIDRYSYRSISEAQKVRLWDTASKRIGTAVVNALEPFPTDNTDDH